jgi:prepilin-type N-terminal cleavage/methylation domain-containing protein
MRRQAFSLTELLVALGIIAVVAAIVVPRFLAVQASAQETTEAENVRTINRTFAVWEAAGGYAGANAKTSEVLRAIGAQPGDVMTIDSGTTDTSDDVTDSTSTPTPSSSVRVALPTEIRLQLDAQTSPQAFVSYGNSLMYYNPSSSSFALVSTEASPTPIASRVLRLNGGPEAFANTVLGAPPSGTTAADILAEVNQALSSTSNLIISSSGTLSTNGSRYVPRIAKNVVAGTSISLSDGIYRLVVNGGNSNVVDFALEKLN